MNEEIRRLLVLLEDAINIGLKHHDYRENYGVRLCRKGCQSCKIEDEIKSILDKHKEDLK